VGLREKDEADGCCSGIWDVRRRKRARQVGAEGEEGRGGDYKLRFAI